MANVDIRWPKMYSLVQEIGLNSLNSQTTYWSTNSHDSSATIHLPIVPTQSMCQSFQFQTYVKNVGDRGVTSKPAVDRATFYCCIMSEDTGAFVVTAVSLQRLWTFGLGKEYTRKCLTQKENVTKVYCSYSSDESPESLVLIENTGTCKTYCIINFQDCII